MRANHTGTGRRTGVPRYRGLSAYGKRRETGKGKGSPPCCPTSTWRCSTPTARTTTGPGPISAIASKALGTEVHIGADEGAWLVALYSATSVSAMAFAPWCSVTFSLRRFTLCAIALFTLLAVLSTNRSAIFPEVPTIAESGFPGFEASVWYGLVAPAATPKPIVAKLHAEVQKALQTKEVRERMTAVGGEVLPGSSEQFAQLIRSERRRYEKLVREANIQPD